MSGATACCPPKGTPETRLAVVFTEITKAIDAYSPDVFALESLFFSTNKKTALSVAEARGVALAAAGLCGLPVAEFSPAQVKLAVTWLRPGDKKAIGQMIPQLIVLPPKKRRMMSSMPSQWVSPHYPHG